MWFAVIRGINNARVKLMPKLMGIDIPGKKRIEYSLRYIYGIGLSKAQLIVKKAEVDPNKRADQLTGDEITKITNILQDGYVLEGDLRREVSQNIKRLITIGCYRGLRHRKGLPVRGQRTHTNARTRKGPRKTVGVVRGDARSVLKAEGAGRPRPGMVTTVKPSEGAAPAAAKSAGAGGAATKPAAGAGPAAAKPAAKT
jgi:small subunit ribosomal protein S13